MTARAGSRGFTMVELIIAITIAAVVLGATWKLLTSNQRFYRAQSELQDVQQNLRAATQIVPGDLRELDAKGGDILAMSAGSITIRAMRGFGVVCAAPDQVNGYVKLQNALLFMSGAIDATRHNAIVFRELDPTKNTDDTWQRGTISASTTASQTCTDGTAATRLTVTLANGNAFLGGVTVGAPVRIFEQVKYLAYDDGTGVWWLGTSTYQSGAWTSTTPVAGPIVATTGIAFAYYDSSGTVTSDSSHVASIGMTVRGQSLRPIMVQGHPTGPYKDSVTVRVALRNN
jgi:prepilin-type N-terminal cleavage/methylation domain-containing protein